MPFFEYYVKDKTGKDVKGVEESLDSSELVRKLKAQGYMVIRIVEVNKAQPLFRLAKGTSATPDKKQAKGKSGSITIDDMVVFARQLATLVAAGIPLVQSLDILSKQVDKQQFCVILSKCSRTSRRGKVCQRP